ncbi:hypothetical protein RHMOL_Rhmol01G0228100 [Rhododendron molle]|uniref:Uncharacterized protein n=1 Tax=Rhododendron molle TaxID=49168 RepID=A0ACC0Q5Q6_RHOML|nr:hypothetical protein RHMOL_Rhmol01G0228100 [Rhododendron molle]
MWDKPRRIVLAIRHDLPEPGDPEWLTTFDDDGSCYRLTVALRIAGNGRYIYGPSPRNPLRTKTGLCIYKALELSKLRQFIAIAPSKRVPKGRAKPTWERLHLSPVQRLVRLESQSVTTEDSPRTLLAALQSGSLSTRQDGQSASPSSASSTFEPPTMSGQPEV